MKYFLVNIDYLRTEKLKDEASSYSKILNQVRLQSHRLVLADDISQAADKVVEHFSKLSVDPDSKYRYSIIGTVIDETIE